MKKTCKLILELVMFIVILSNGPELMLKYNTKPEDAVLCFGVLMYWYHSLERIAFSDD